MPVNSTGVSKRINDQARKNSTAKERAVPRGSPVATPNKTEALLKLLRSSKGATLETLMNAVGWQAHSVRGFLSGTVKKKLGLYLISESGRDGIRRYRIDSAAKIA